MKVGATKLNNIETYTELLNRSKRNGYVIQSVIYNGYTSSKELQNIQDNAIQQRTQLRLNTEIDEQKNKLIDLKIKSENERLNLQNELNKSKFDFEQNILDKKAGFELIKSKMKNEVDLKIKEIEANSKIENKKQIQDLNENYLNNLSDLGVDVNAYEIELVKSENRLDTLYELVS